MSRRFSFLQPMSMNYLKVSLVPLEERLKFHSLHRSIKEGLDVTDIIKSSWAVIQSRMGVLENLEANKDSIKEKLLQYPTKTAQNHLNFVSKEGELELKDKFNQTEYHSIIEAAFKLINVLCGENTEVVISDQTLGDLLLKYNCINLSNKIF